MGEQDAVKITMSGDAADLLRKYEQVISKQEEVIGGLKKTARESKQTASENVMDAEKMTQGFMKVAGMLTGVGSIAAGIGIVREAYRKWKGEVEDGKKVFEEFHGYILKSLATTADLADIKKIEKEMFDISKKIPYISPTEATQVRQTIRGVLPEAAPGVIKELTGEAAKARVFDIGSQDIDVTTQYAETAGWVRKLNPTMSVGDVMDTARVIISRSGKFGTKMEKSGWKAIGEITGAGIGTFDETMGLLLSQLQEGGQVSSLSEINNRAKFEKLLTGRPKEIAQELRRARAENIFQEGVSGVIGESPYRDMLGIQAVKVQSDIRMAEVFGQKELTKEKYKNLVEKEWLAAESRLSGPEKFGAMIHEQLSDIDLWGKGETISPREKAKQGLKNIYWMESYPPEEAEKMAEKKLEFFELKEILKENAKATKELTDTLNKSNELKPRNIIDINSGLE